MDTPRTRCLAGRALPPPLVICDALHRPLPICNNLSSVLLRCDTVIWLFQRVTGEGLDPSWPPLRSIETIRGILYYSNPASEKPATFDAAFGNLFKAWSSYDEGRKFFPDNGVFPNNLGSVYAPLVFIWYRFFVVITN